MLGHYAMVDSKIVHTIQAHLDFLFTLVATNYIFDSFFIFIFSRKLGYVYFMFLKTILENSF